MKDEEQLITTEIHQLRPEEINQHAVNMLNDLLERCTVNLVSTLTGITRPTLYKWLDDEVSLEQMNHYYAAYFILICETSPKVRLLMNHAPLSHPRLAKRLVDADEDKGGKVNGS